MPNGIAQIGVAILAIICDVSESLAAFRPIVGVIRQHVPILLSEASRREQTSSTEIQCDAILERVKCLFTLDSK